MPHRNSVTIKNKKGRWVNVAGKKASTVAAQIAQDKEAATSKGFSTVKQAVAAAKRRSRREIPPGARQK